MVELGSPEALKGLVATSLGFAIMSRVIVAKEIQLGQLVQIPLAYSLAIPLRFGANGVFAAITIAESLLAVVAILVFRRGKWKEQKV